MELSSTQFAEVRRLFHALFDAPETVRSNALARAATADATVAAFVRRLLADADTHVDVDAAATFAPAVTLADGAIVAGRYRVQRMLGEGGMGEVYLADRIDGIAQQVALKLVRGGSVALHRRFVRERQILARLVHPHIARLVDGGLSETGVPWFAMEYVDGASITVACDRDRLDLRARARLIAEVCRAVQFAHRNLVLHRDLKPSNILVDGEGTPRLLDFGIARLLDDTACERQHTLTMTPAYAPPEQLRGELVTTAGDVYQLGLLACELLAGISAHELLRRRRFADGAGKPFLRPSLAFAQTAPDLAARIAAARGLGTAQLARELRGDLDRLIAKALADDPRERYETAQALGDDLLRWVDGLPLLAQRGSFAYRTGKLLHRHAYAASALALLAFGLLASSVYALNRAHQERQQRERAETVLAFMRDVFRQGDPQNASGAQVDTAELFVRAAATLEQRSDIDDVAGAVLLREIADVLSSLGREDKTQPIAARAVAMLEPVRAAHPQEYLESVETLVGALRELSRVDDELALIERALPVARAAGAVPRDWSAVFMIHRGYAQLQRNRFDLAAADLDAAIADLDDGDATTSADLATALYERAVVASQRGDLRRARTLLERAAVLLAAAKGASKRDLLVTREMLARLGCQFGQPHAGIDALDKVQGDFMSLLGAANNRTLMTGVSLALCEFGRGDYPRAAALLDAVASTQRAGALTPSQLAHLRDSVARLDLYRLRIDAALSAARANVASVRRLEQGSWVYLARASWTLGESLVQAGRCDEATPILEAQREAIRAAQATLPSALAGDVEDSLGRCLMQQGAFESARARFANALGQMRGALDTGAAAIVRGEIHLLWSEIALRGDARLLDRLGERRTALVAALGSDDRPQVWQLDLLIDALSRQFDRAGIDTARRAKAVAGIEAMAVTAQVPHFVGLNAFF